MQTKGVSGSTRVMCFVGTSAPDKARSFYRDTLGLELVGEDGFALTFETHGATLRVTTVAKVTVAPYTVLGWQVGDIAASVKALTAAGVAFQHYKGMPQDDLGIWTAPGGAKIAWFQDPDGNTLSLAQM
jgi:catechol 2,3-dioxygenase-like lactoylglutathione lyase family enzyme